MPWLLQLQEKVMQHINYVHHQQWEAVPMTRGAYFHHPDSPIIQGHNFRACHFFVNNYSDSIHIFHCAAKLEHNQMGNIPPAIQGLFVDNEQVAAAGGGLEIAWAEIVHPIDFNVADDDQDLPDDLWIDIQARFLLRPSLMNFIDQWEHH